MAPKSAAPASSSSYATSSGEEEEEVSGPKKKNSSSSAPPNALKPSTTTIAAAPQPPQSSKPFSTSAAQAAKLQSSKPSSSTEDDDEDGEEEAESSGSDEEDESASDSGDNRSKPTPPPSQPQPPPKPTTTEASDTGSTDDSDSEPDSSDQPTPIRHSSRVANPSIKPLASKPMEPPSKPKKPVLAPVPDSDKKKKALEAAPEQESGGQKRQNFLRIWSEEDEIAILRGMADYHTKMGTVPSSSDMDAFYNSVHKSIQMEVSKSQLLEKVRRLKKKYETITVRGKNPSFTKPHEQTAYELSKKIWGENKTLLEDGDATNGGAIEGDATDNSARKRRKTKEEHIAVTSNGMAAHADYDATNVKVPHPFLSVAVSQMGVVLPSSLPVNRVLELVDDTKVMALEEKYKKLRLLEIKNHLRQMDLMKETIKLVVDAIEKLG